MSKLHDAASAVIDRWNSPLWKDLPHTAEYINDLERAIADDPNKKAIELWNLCKKFIDDQNIGCPETIYQTDWVIENAYHLIERICDIVGYKESEE